MADRKTNIELDFTGVEPRVKRADEEDNDYEDMSDLLPKTVAGSSEDDLGEQKTQTTSKHLTKNQKKIVSYYQDNPDATKKEIAEDVGVSESSAHSAVKRGTLAMPLMTNTQIKHAMESLSSSDRAVVRDLTKGPDTDMSVIMDDHDIAEQTFYAIRSNNEPLIHRLFKHDDSDDLWAEVDDDATTIPEPAGTEDDEPVTEDSELQDGTIDGTVGGLEANASHIALIEELNSLHELFERQLRLSESSDAGMQLALVEHLMEVAVGADEDK